MNGIHCSHFGISEEGSGSPGWNFAQYDFRSRTMMSSGFMEKTLAQVASRIQ